MRGCISNIIVATRFERTLVPISFIMIAVAFANKINLDIIILISCCFLIYISGGILNAKTDNDFKVKYSKTIIFLLIGGTLTISLANKIIFFTTIIWIILSFIYSKYSRKILFGDSVLLSLTHATVGAISAAIILELNTQFLMHLGIFLFSSFLLLVPIKNFNGIEEDIERGYKTLMTISRDGKVLTYVLFNFYLIVMFLSYFVFNLGENFLIIFSFILTIKIMIDYFVYNGNEILAYKLARLVILLFSFAFIVDQSRNPKIILISLSMMILYLIYLIKNVGRKHEIL